MKFFHKHNWYYLGHSQFTKTNKFVCLKCLKIKEEKAYRDVKYG